MDLFVRRPARLSLLTEASQGPSLGPIGTGGVTPENSIGHSRALEDCSGQIGVGEVDPGHRGVGEVNVLNIRTVKIGPANVAPISLAPIRSESSAEVPSMSVLDKLAPSKPTFISVAEAKWCW